ncbi:Homeobox domain-containing protein [Psidium guajava]|nr:Homeobox domain-containing protein [Psidium guajava]
MGIATPPLPPISSHTKPHHHHSIAISNPTKSMSQDYHHPSIFAFSNNGFERPDVATASAATDQEQQHHVAQQICRDKLRVQDYDAPPPPQLVGMDEEPGGLPAYETAGMLSEMFNFPPGGAATAELQEQPMASGYRGARPSLPTGEWYGSKNPGVYRRGESNMSQQHHHAHHHHQQQQQNQISNMNAESAAAMQLFLMNPQARSPSPPTPHHHHHHHPPPTSSSTLQMLLPNPSPPPSLQGFHVSGSGSAAPNYGTGMIPPAQFTWVHDGSGATAAQLNSPNEISGATVVEGQGLSLSLSSSLQHLGAAKAEELRIGDSGLLFFNQAGGGGSANSSASASAVAASVQYQHQLKNLGVHNLQNHHHQVHVGYGSSPSSSSLGVVNVLRNSRYLKAAQELLEEFCSVGRGQFKKGKFGRNTSSSNPSSNPSNNKNSSTGAVGGGASSSSSKDIPPLSAADRMEHQRRKVKLLSMLDEVERRYNHYCEQMQMVVNMFDLVMGYGAAVPYTALAQKAMSRHFRCLRDAIAAQLKHSCELLGEKDGAGGSGITKGETPRLKLLDQSLRQQRAFHQMGMMEQEAWRPQRGLPERSVNILRAWLFEHFLHPYPSDADKHLLARQTGLSRNQVSNWFINARVRLWKPMVEEMYQQEAKDEDEDDDDHQAERSESSRNNLSASGHAQTPTPSPIAPPPIKNNTNNSSSNNASGPTRRSEINAPESDPSLTPTINRHSLPETQATTTLIQATTAMISSNIQAAGPAHMMDDPCHRHGGIGADIGSALIRFGTATAASGDVSLTLGLRHAGNAPEKNSFSVTDLGGC